MVKTIHLVEGHEHVACEHFDTHLHQSEMDCPIEDFHFTSFDLSPETVITLEKPVFYLKTPAVHKADPVDSKTRHSYLLRGPPVAS